MTHAADLIDKVYVVTFTSTQKQILGVCSSQDKAIEEIINFFLKPLFSNATYADLYLASLGEKCGHSFSTDWKIFRMELYNIILTQKKIQTLDDGYYSFEVFDLLV